MTGRPPRSPVLSAVLVASVLLLDLALPDRFAVHAGYIGVLLSGLWWPSSRHVVLGAALCTMLTIVGGFTKPPGGSVESAPINRPQTIVLIWITAALVAQHRRVTRRALQLAAVVDSSDDAIVSVSQDGVVHTWSAGAVRLLGWTADEMLGRRRWDLVPAECVDETAAALERARRGERPEPFDTVRIAADGRRLDVSVRFSALKDPDGRVVGVSAVLRDISERRRVEEQVRMLRRAEQDLAHTGRVATMAELATSIAHELNQPLAAIVSNGDACLRWLKATPPRLEAARDSVRHMIDDARRASTVIERVRTLLRGSDVEAAALDVNEVIADTLTLAQHHAASFDVSLRSDLAPDLPAVVGDRVEVQQVVLNLVLNGVDAAGEAAHGPREVMVRSRLEAPTTIKVAVLDTGPGVPKELCGRVFAPFYTTKPQGLGLGLSLSRSIIERMGGRLWASHGQGSGGQFEFTLPGGEGESRGR